MIPLNLPAFEYNVKNKDGKVLIFDVVRKKHVVLTPEEWVRQHFIHFMINHLQYPKSLIRIESGLSYNSLKKRSDIVVYNREGTPWMVVECKAPDQQVDARVMRQVSVYNTSLKAPYLAITNGLRHICCAIDHPTQNVAILDNFPSF